MSKSKLSKKEKQAARILELSKPGNKTKAVELHQTTEPSPVLSHDENSRVMMTEVQSVLKVAMQARFAKMSDTVASTSSGQIEFANMARDMGRDIQIFTNHQKLLPADFNKFSAALVLKEQDTASMAFAKECLSTFVAHPDLITDLKVARGVYERLEQLMLALPKPTHGPQERHPDEKVKDLWTESGRLVNEQQRLRKDFEAETDVEKRADLLAQINLYREAIKKQVAQIIEFGEWIASLPTDVPA